MNFWDFLWLIIWSFFFIMYLMVLFQVVADLFRDGELSGIAKAIWVLALIALPFLSLLIYLIARGKGMNQRTLATAQANKAASDAYIRSVASTDPTSQIANAKVLLDSGAITAAEFEQLKATALGRA